MADTRFCTLISFITGVAIYAVNSTRTRLEARNELLQNQVQQGMIRLEAQEAELRTAGAQAMRTRILEDVTRFCNGNFQDDASLIVITVE